MLKNTEIFNPTVMAFETLLTTLENNVFTITINRPDKLNALNKKTVAEIGEAIASAKKEDAVKAIIITGAGPKSFVAGADIAEFIGLSIEQGKALAQAGQDVFRSIETCPKPVIAAVNGFALGGGCELSMACHLRIASENAKFGQPEVNLGLIAGYGGTQRLIQYLGKTKATELHMTADMITAQQALELGLVNYVVPQDQLMTKCMEVIEKIKSKSPKAITGVINSVNAYFETNTDGFKTEIEEFGKCFGTDDFKEGTSAFIEKRKANFTGK
jgi:enoyl-CoA hydratase